MSGELTVSVGGGSRVAVDELFAEAAVLGALELAADEWSERARRIRTDLVQSGVVDAPGGGSSDAAFSLAHARSLLAGVAREATQLRSSLIASAERYGETERAVTAMWDLGVRALAANAGLLALLAGPLLLAPGLQAGMFLQRAAAAGAWNPKATGRKLLSDPAFIRIVRAAGGAVDEFALGLSGVPAPLALLFGAGLRAPENATLLLGAAGGLGLLGSSALVDGPVSVRRDAAVGAAGVRAPTSVSEVTRRIPAPAAGGPQIRVERYGPGAAPRWVVYVSGTLAPTPVAGTEPLDLTSDVHALAEGSRLEGLRSSGADSGAADRAVRRALAEAGARPGDPVLPVGYSAGGIVAANLARDPAMNVVGAVNLGGPVSSMAFGDLPVLSIEHDDDLVPALGGMGHPSPGLVTVRRAAMAGDPSAGAEWLPAHELVRYRTTAELADRAKTPEVQAFGALIREFTGDADGVRSDWVAARVSRAPDAR